VSTVTALRAAASLCRAGALHFVATVRAGSGAPMAISGSPVAAVCAARWSTEAPGMPVRDRPLAGTAGSKARLWSVHGRFCLCPSARCGVTPRCREVKLR